MPEWLQGTLIVILLLYIAVCMLWVPTNLLEYWAERRTCAEQHDVFTCHKVETWVAGPAPKGVE